MTLDPVALCEIGFEPDPRDPRVAFFTTPGGERLRVYIKRARNPKRQAVELAAIALIREQSPHIPLPRVVSAFDLGDESCLAFEYIDGANLGDLLARGVRSLPRPLWYEPVHLSGKPHLSVLLPLLSDVGKAVRELHAVRLAQFGRLPGTSEEPNPYRDQARAFTAQEFNHRILVGLEKQTLPPALAEAARRWYVTEVERLSDDEQPCLVHFDLHTGNVRVSGGAGQWRLRALYDFELARGWLPEYDLALLAWDLSFLEDEDPPGVAWQAFLAGYGPVDPGRLRLFQVMYVLGTIAYLDRYPAWGRWGLDRLAEMM